MTSQLRSRNGQYQYTPFKHSQWSGAILLISIMIVGATIDFAYKPSGSLLSPCPATGCSIPHIAKVQASEPIVVPLNTYNAPQNIVDLVVKYFGDEAQNALKIVGTCENKGWNPTATNQNKNGSWDAGIFQVNSVHGYSQDYLFNPENNIKIAKKIFGYRGWTSWSCSHVLNITPFYMQGAK